MYNVLLYYVDFWESLIQLNLRKDIFKDTQILYMMC